MRTLQMVRLVASLAVADQCVFVTQYRSDAGAARRTPPCQLPPWPRTTIKALDEEMKVYTYISSSDGQFVTKARNAAPRFVRTDKLLD